VVVEAGERAMGAPERHTVRHCRMKQACQRRRDHPVMTGVPRPADWIGAGPLLLAPA